MANVTTSSQIWSEEDMSMPESPFVLLKGYRRLQLQKLMSFYGLKFDPETTTGEMMRDELMKVGAKIPKPSEFNDMISVRKSAKEPVEEVIKEVVKEPAEVVVEKSEYIEPAMFGDVPVAKKQKSVKKKSKKKG
jgi:hypothetical protein